MTKHLALVALIGTILLFIVAAVVPESGQGPAALGAVLLFFVTMVLSTDDDK